MLVFEPKSNYSIVDDCVSKVEIQPLQAGESLIGAVKLCKETALGLVLVDYNYSVFLFNAAGELQNAISRVGRSRKSSIKHYPNEDSPLYRLLHFPVCMTNDDVVLYVCDNESLREYKGMFGFLQSVEIPLSEGVSLLKFHF